MDAAVAPDPQLCFVHSSSPSVRIIPARQSKRYLPFHDLFAVVFVILQIAVAEEHKIPPLDGFHFKRECGSVRGKGK